MKTVRMNTKLVGSLGSVLFMQAAEMIVATDIPNSTWYRIMQTPETISIQQLLAIANGLHIPVRRFFSKDRTDIIGRREDYVAEPYVPCTYDHHALQRLVNERPGTTWQKAAEATGMAPSRLRNSLLAVTRTPVTRFLTVCDTFGVDPFTILLDPNPEPAPETKGRGRRQDQADLRAEISELRGDIRRLSDTVDDLMQKYEMLLDAHKSLVKRVNVNIENVSSSYIGIAADPLSPTDDDK